MKRRRDPAPGAVETFEQAVHLLRGAPFATWLLYLTGAVPFVVGLLYFWADMSQSAFAGQRAVGAAFGMTLLYFWLKTFQALFAARLHEQLIAVPPASWTARQILGRALDQVRLQSWGLLVLPIAVVLTVPAGLTYWFFQTLTVLPADAARGSRVRRAWRETFRQPLEDHACLLLLVGLGLMLVLNLMVLLFLVPQLLKSLFDIETLFSRSPWAAMNTTLGITVLAVGWLCWDPLVKAVCLIRAFQGEGRESGADLVARLRAIARPAVAVLVVMTGLLVAPNARAADAEIVSPENVAASEPAAPRVRPSAAELDRAIEDVLRERRYSWRMPREAVEAAEEDAGLLRRWADSFSKFMGNTIGRVFRWIADLFEPRARTPSDSNISFADAAVLLKWLLIVLVVVILGALVWILVKAWIGRPKVVATATESAPAVPDITDENVSADQLPEDGWLRLAADLIAQGDLRLALRAFYLASLAHLARRELIRLARHKSNRDYEREVGRRARALPQVAGAFSDNVRVFDRVWYGRDAASEELMREFRANVERIRAC